MSPTLWYQSLAAPSAQLAALRVVVAATLLLSPELHVAERLAAHHPELRVAPEGLGWFVAHVPISPSIARAVRAVFLVSASLTLMGFRARTAALCMTVSAFYLMALSQLSGSVLHDMHLLWFAALLAASPCGDAWSLDVWSPGAPRDPSRDLSGRRCSVAYGVPIWTVRLLLAAVYFFPGYWKLRTSGLAWIFSDNLVHQMHWKWFEAGGWTPAWRVDRSPSLVRAGALAVVCFELGFPLLLLRRRTRLVAAACGLAFHLASDALLRIPFASLWMSYVALVDWPASPLAPLPLKVEKKQLALAALLVSAAVVQGARGQMQAWPFACYPTFQWIVPDTIPDVRIEAELADGTRVPVRARGARSNDRWAMAWRVAGLYGDPVRGASLRAYVATVLSDGGRALPRSTVRVHLWRAFYDVRPERYGAAPVREEPIGSFTPRR